MPRCKLLFGCDGSALRFIGKPLSLPFMITGWLLAYAFGTANDLAATPRVLPFRIMAGQVLFSLCSIGLTAMALYVFLHRGDLGFAKMRRKICRSDHFRR